MGTDKEAIRAFITSSFPRIAIEGDQLRFPGVGITSIELIELVIGIERQFGARFRLSEITELNFSSLETIAELLQRR
jgi:acyl carrier protein